MPFKITIEETKPVTKTVGRDWTKIDEVQKEGVFGDRAPYLADVMGYTPTIEKTVDVTTTVLEQTVEELDLVAVIKAVNKIA